MTIIERLRAGLPDTYDVTDKDGDALVTAAGWRPGDFAVVTPRGHVAKYHPYQAWTPAWTVDCDPGDTEAIVTAVLVAVRNPDSVVFADLKELARYLRYSYPDLTCDGDIVVIPKPGVGRVEVGLNRQGRAFLLVPSGRHQGVTGSLAYAVNRVFTRRSPALWKENE